MSWLYHRITFWSRFCSDQEVLIVTIHLLVLSREWMGMGEWGNGGMGLLLLLIVIVDHSLIP